MGEISLKDALNKFLTTSRLKNGIRAVRIEEIWGEIMGSTIAKYTDKISISGNTLFISTNVAPLKNELMYQKDTIKDRVNEALGEKAISQVVIK